MLRAVPAFYSECPDADRQEFALLSSSLASLLRCFVIPREFGKPSAKAMELAQERFHPQCLPTETAQKETDWSLGTLPLRVF